MGIAGRAGYNQRLIALERLTGQALGGDWFSWAEWYEGSDIAPPPGFASWKGGLWTRIDPRFGELIADAHPTRIRVEEIDWGGIPFEGIPALDDPRARRGRRGAVARRRASRWSASRSAAKRAPTRCASSTGTSW